MSSISSIKRRRGRPPKDQAGLSETRECILRSGMEILTEKGYLATGIDEVLRQVDVPKGSFYHYFDSKEGFGLALIKSYSNFFMHKLDKHLNDKRLAPIERLNSFLVDATKGMARYNFRRGCLVGNLGQEMSALPESFRNAIRGVFEEWENKVEKCLREAQVNGHISSNIDCKESAYIFWIGWEGAVLRAKLEQKPNALLTFSKFFLESLR